MPRPGSITEADLAEWKRGLEESDYAPLASVPLFLETWYGGEWLARELSNAGATDREREDVCFAAGQCAAFRRDPWPAFEESLAKFREGCPDRPGPELADKLYSEMMGQG